MNQGLEIKSARKLSSEDIKRAVGVLLYTLRIEHNDSLEKISFQTGLSPAKIRSIENGRQMHTWNQYQRLLDFYQRDIKITISLANRK